LKGVGDSDVNLQPKGKKAGLKTDKPRHDLMKNFLESRGICLRSLVDNNNAICISYPT